jgi:hypothetical protein
MRAAPPRRASLRRALSALHDATFHGARGALDGGSERVCAAYHYLRASANGMRLDDLYRLASEALGRDVRELAVTAYARRRCFMCRKGFVRCDDCDGAPPARDGTCRRCDGLGAAACDFCGGTGWAGHDTIPRELASAVQKRRLAELYGAVKHLAAALRKVGRAPPRLPALQRRRLARLARRLRARAADLAEHGLPRDADRRHRLADITERLDRATQRMV